MVLSEDVRDLRALHVRQLAAAIVVTRCPLPSPASDPTAPQLTRTL